MNAFSLRVARFLLLMPLLAPVLGILGTRTDGPADGRLPEDRRLPTIQATITYKRQGIIKSVAFSPDNKVVAAGGSAGGVSIYDVATARERYWFPKGYTPKVTFSADGKSLVVGSFGPSNVTLLDAETGAFRLTLEVPTSVERSSLNCLAYAPDGKSVVAGYNSGEVVIWDATTGRRRAVIPPYMIPPHTEPLVRADQPIPAQILALAITPDGTTLLTCAYTARVRFWDMATGAERSPPADLGRPGRLAFSRDGKTLAMSRDREIEVWDVATWRKRASIRAVETIHALAFLPDGQTLATIEGERFLRLYTTVRATERPLAELMLAWAVHVEAFAVSPDGRWIAAGGFDTDPMFGIIYLVETDGKTLRPRPPRREP